MLAKTLAFSAFAAVAMAAPSKRGWNGDSGEHHGSASFYDLFDAKQNEGHVGEVDCQPGNRGDIGELSNSGLFVAIKKEDGEFCGKKIKVKIDETGKEGVFTVIDRCGGCEDGGVDFPMDTWQSFSGFDRERGLFDVTWEWVE